MQNVDLKGGLRRWWGLIVGAVALGALLGFLIGPPSAGPTTTTYQASHILLAEGVPEPEVEAGLVAFLATVGTVPERVAARLADGTTAESATEMVTVESSPLGAVTITAEAPDRAEAVAVVDAFGEEVLAVRLDEQRSAVGARLAETEGAIEGLEGRVATLQSQVTARSTDSQAATELSAARSELAALTERRAELSAELERVDGSLRTVQPGKAVAIEQGGTDVPLGRLGTAAIGAIAGLLLGAVAALLLARYDPRLHERRAVEHSYGFPVVAGIPVLPRQWRRRREVITTAEPTSASAEAFRKLRTTIDRLVAQVGMDSVRPLKKSGRVNGSRPSRGGHVILISSALPSEGKTTLVANLAATYARSGRSVVVVSGDLRAPSVNEFLDVAPDHGLADVASGPVTTQGLLRETSIDGVKMVLDGSSREGRSPADQHGSEPVEASPGDLLEQARDVISDLRREADVILIDTPPLLPFNDVGELLPAVDGVVVVARLGRVTAADGERTHEALDRLGAPVLGVVVIGEPVDAQIASYYSASTRTRRRWTHQPNRSLDVAPGPPSEGPGTTGPGASEQGDEAKDAVEAVPAGTGAEPAPAAGRRDR